MNANVKTALVVGGALVGGYIVVKKLIPPTSATSRNVGSSASSKSSPISIGGLLNSGFSALGSLLSKNQSNQIADKVAADDTATGVVGFGGWDANSLADSTAAADSTTGVVGFGGWGD